MTTIVHTQSGTEYELDGMRVRRVMTAFNAEWGDMRRDGEWLNLYTEVTPVVGFPMVMALEPLGLGNVTIRTTSNVLSVEEVSHASSAANAAPTGNEAA